MKNTTTQQQKDKQSNLKNEQICIDMKRYTNCQEVHEKMYNIINQASESQNHNEIPFHTLTHNKYWQKG